MLDGLNKIFFVLLIIQQTDICNGKNNFGLSVIYLNASFNPDKISDFKYNHHNEKDKAKLYYEFKFKETVTHVAMRGIVDMLRADNKRINLLDITQDCCQLAGLFQSKNRMVKIFSREFMRVSNYKGCPVLANKPIYIRNYTIDPNLFPPFTPSLYWTVQIHLIVDKIYYASTFFKGNIYKL